MILPPQPFVFVWIPQPGFSALLVSYQTVQLLSSNAHDSNISSPILSPPLNPPSAKPIISPFLGADPFMQCWSSPFRFRLSLQRKEHHRTPSCADPTNQSGAQPPRERKCGVSGRQGPGAIPVPPSSNPPSNPRQEGFPSEASADPSLG